MKWQRPENGSDRVRTLFAWYPVYLELDRTWVWLERVTVVERYWHGGGWTMIREQGSKQDHSVREE